jgi:hypothetical protein
MAKERQDVVGVNCLKSDGGNVVIDPDEIKNAEVPTIPLLEEFFCFLVHILPFWA